MNLKEYANLIDEADFALCQAMNRLEEAGEDGTVKQLNAIRSKILRNLNAIYNAR